MRITAFNGSPRKDHGNTHVMVSEFLKGATEAGAEVENVFLAEQNITPCIGCYACWTTCPGKCVHADDMAGLLDKFLSSDTVVIASPVYVDNVTGIMKNFMDRLITIADPHMEKDQHGECRHVKRHDKPTKIIAISNCGFPEQSHFQVLRILFRRMARNLHCDLAAEIYRGGGGLLTSKLPEAGPAVERYRNVLRRTGMEVVREGRVSEQTLMELEQPLVPLQANLDRYIAAVNQMWDARLARARHTEG